MSYGYNPYFTPMQTQRMELTRVNGIAGAQAYQMPPNSVAALFDASTDLMYIKSTDGAGFPSIRTFAFSEQTEAPQAQSATLDRIMTTLDEIKEALNGKQSVREPKPAK